MRTSLKGGLGSSARHREAQTKDVPVNLGRVSTAEIRKMLAKPKRSKYGNVRTKIDGITFASKKEARRYQELRLLQKGGKIHGLRYQQRYDLTIDGQKIGEYVSDFTYHEKPDGAWVVEDVKGLQTAVFKLKWKMVHALYPYIEWRIV